MPFWIKADGMMLIVAIDLYTTYKENSSAFEWNRSTYKGGIIVDILCPSGGCHPFFVYESIYACSAKIGDIFLPLKFCWQCFCVLFPDIIRNLKERKKSSRNMMSIKYIFCNRQPKNIRTYNILIPCQKSATCVYVLFR